jgi:2-dehydropantoate 2-reductase
MRIFIFGAGSLGSAMGGVLAGRNEVVLIGRRAHVRAVQRKGLRIVGDLERTIHLEAHESLRGLAPPQLLMVATKAYDTKESIRSLRRSVPGDAMVLTLQNGLGNLEQIRAWKADKAFGGTTTMGATLVAPGVVRLSGLGRTVIGSDLDPSGAREIVSAFASSGLPVTSSEDILTEIWAKAVVNASMNPVAAVLRVPNGRLIESAVISHLMKDVVVECTQVANAMGIKLGHEDLYRRLVAICSDTSENIGSMLQDVERGRRTEIEQINGAFCSSGEIARVPTPLNDALVSIIRSLAHAATSEKG